MNEKIRFGSVEKEYKLDDEGSTLKTVLSSVSGSLPKQPLKLVYTIRHSITHPSQEQDIYRLFDERHMRFPLFDTKITFDKKNPLNKTGKYYMIEHFTIYKKDSETPQVRAFIEAEKKELGL